MREQMVKIIPIVLLLSGNIYGQIVLSEILSNEPEGRVRLEWLEVYNRSDLPVNLEGYILIADTDTNYLPEGVFIDGGGFAVLARQLLPDNGSDSFEGHWGDSSGIWGDSPSENYQALDINMTLSNGGGFIIWADSLATLDYVSWSIASDDGRSLERDDLLSDGSDWHDCYDSYGSTPGRVNSLIPDEGRGAFTASVNPEIITPDGDGLDDYFTIEIVIPPGARLNAEVFDETGYREIILAEESSQPVSLIRWAGLDDKNNRLRPGVYIIAFHLSGQKDDSEFIPVVIAP